MSEATPLISVIILTANRRAALERCLQSLRSQGWPCLEVIVVDNGSADGTREWLAQTEETGDWPFRLQVIEGDPRASFAEARNLGVDAASGSLVAFLDDDCEAHPGWLERIAANLREADASGGLTVPPESLVFPWWWDAHMSWAVGLQGPEHRDPALAGSLAYPDTSNLAARRDVLRREPFQAIGGALDGTQGVYRWGREDAELWRRLRLHGHRTRFDPAQCVTHHIDPARLAWRPMICRARADGRSLWRREQDVSYLDTACGDIVAWPWRVLRSLRLPPPRWIPAILGASLWRRRQTAFVLACVRDRGIGVAMRPVARALLGALRGGLKRAVRPALWLGVRLIKGPLWQRLPSDPKSVCVACQGFLGDTVLLGPLLEVLRAQHPEARVTLLTNRFGRELHGASPYVDEVIEISPPRFLFGWERWKEVRRRLRALRPAAVLVPYWHHAPAWPLLVSHRAPVIGFDGDMGFRRQLWHDLLDRRVAKDFGRHEIHSLLALAAVLGPVRDCPPGYCLPALPPPTPHIGAFVREHALATGQFIALHIGATGVGKDWPDARWAALARSLTAHHPGLRQVFIGHAALRLRVQRLIDDQRLSAVNACANRPLADLAALLQGARLLITTDSGPKHLAMALGTPTVALYAHSSPRRWGAWCEESRHHAVLSPGHDLRPEELGPRGPGHKMALITVEAVEAAVEGLLAQPA